MKISKEPVGTRNKKILFFTMILFFLGAATAVALEKTKVTDFIKTAPDSGPTAEQVNVQNEADQTAKEDFIKTPDPTPRTPEEVNANSNIDLTAQEETNGTVTVLTKLNGIPSGSCSLTIRNGAKEYSDFAEVIYQPDFSTCAGFSVPKNKLGPGVWSINLSVSGVVDKNKAITFEVQ